MAMGRNQENGAIATPFIRILVVEDSKSDLLLVNKMLRSVMQHQTIELANATRMSTALAMLDASPFDIVLLDFESSRHGWRCQRYRLAQRASDPSHGRV